MSSGHRRPLRPRRSYDSGLRRGFGSSESLTEVRVRDITRDIGYLEERTAHPGNYSFVYKGLYGDEEVAIKILWLVTGKSRTAMRRKMERERKVWASLRHANIMPFYGYAYDRNHTFGEWGALVSPWYRNGDANRYLQRRHLSITELTNLWQGVIEGVCYLHSRPNPIVHGDLKPTNILIDDWGNPRICDFGLARIFMEEGASGLTTTSPHSGTERYLAYELVSSEELGMPTTASDIYALGCIGLEFIFSKAPYSRRRHNRFGHIIEDIKNGDPPSYRPEDCAPHIDHLWDIFVFCWRLRPRSRPGARDVLNFYSHWQSELRTLLRRRLISSRDFDISGDDSPPSPTELSDHSDISSDSNSSDSFIGRSPLFEHPPISHNSSRPTSAEPDDRYRRFDDTRGRARRRSISPGSGPDRAYSRSRSNSAGYPTQHPMTSYPPNLYTYHVYNPYLYSNGPAQMSMPTYGPSLPPLPYAHNMTMPSLAPTSSGSYYPRRYPVSAPVSHPSPYQPHFNSQGSWMNPAASSYSEYPRRRRRSNHISKASWLV